MCVSLPEGDTKSSVIVSDSTNSCSTSDNDSYENENDTTKVMSGTVENCEIPHSSGMLFIPLFVFQLSKVMQNFFHPQ